MFNAVGPRPESLCVGKDETKKKLLQIGTNDALSQSLSHLFAMFQTISTFFCCFLDLLFFVSLLNDIDIPEAHRRAFQHYTLYIESTGHGPRESEDRMVLVGIFVCLGKYTTRFAYVNAFDAIARPTDTLYL